LEAATALCAADVIRNALQDPDGCVPSATPDQLATVRAEYDAALQVLVYLPTEGRFYAIWSDAANADYLATFVSAAWSDGMVGEYGRNPPAHWTQKSPKLKPKQRRK
jgi:hypothetical protein